MSEHSFLKFFSCLFTVPAIKSCGKKMPEFWKKDLLLIFTSWNYMLILWDWVRAVWILLMCTCVDEPSVITTINKKWFEDLYFLKGVILKYATTHNHSQPLATIHNYPQSLTVIHNHSQLHTTIHNYPQLPTFTTICNHLKPPTTVQNHPENHP